MKIINLKKTLDGSGMKQVDVGKDLNLSRSHINKYYKTNLMSKGQNMAFILYFEKLKKIVHYQ